MGAACTSDKYKQLRDEYCLQLTKMVIGEKNKHFLDRIIAKLKREISDYAQKTQASANSAIDATQAQIQHFYEQVREELNQRQPGGIKSLEKMTANSAQELLGYNFIKDLLGEVRESTNIRFKQEQHLLLGELVEIKSVQEEQFNSERSTMPIYRDMEADEQEGVLKRGEMEFHDLVVKYEEHILSRYGHRFEQEYYTTRFNNIDPQDALDSLLFLAKDKFVTALNLILSQDIDSYILIDS